MKTSRLSQRAYGQVLAASSWEEIWEAGPYFERLSDLLEEASNYAVLVGWQIDSRLPLKKPLGKNEDPYLSGGRETLKQKVIRICSEKPEFHFYFLFWDHAYFYVFEREIWQGRVWEEVHPRVHFVFDNRHPVGGSHHEKICIIDGKIALCGGIDVCDERWDSPQHLYYDPRRSLDWKNENHGPYHDLAVQVTGPVCSEIQRHVLRRWRALSSIPFPDPKILQPKAPIGEGIDLYHKVYLSRTTIEVEGRSQRREATREIEFLLRDLIFLAERRIVLEGQYYWSEILNDILITKIHQMRGKPFEIFIILSVPQTMKSLTKLMTVYELKLLQKLMLAANFAGVKIEVGAPYSYSNSMNRVMPPRPIYIHSKVCVIDDQFLCIGSANLAARALHIDTEINLTLEAQNKLESRNIERFVQSILKHWNIETNKHRPEKARTPHFLDTSSSGIYLRSLKPRTEFHHLSAILDLTKSFQWQKFIDPKLPWFYFVKIYIKKKVAQNCWLLIFSICLIWVISLFLIRIIVGPEIINSEWPILYSLLLSSTWIFPVPFGWGLLLMSFHLGTAIATKIGVASLWVASSIGYTLTRVFPDSAGRFYRKVNSTSLSKRLGTRNFNNLIEILLDPRIGTHFKIIYQGFYCVPLPWFALGTGMVLPAITYSAARWICPLAKLMLPGMIVKTITTYAGFLFLMTALFCARRVIVGLWKDVN